MTIPADLSDEEIKLYVGRKIEEDYALRVIHPELDPSFKFCTPYPEKEPSFTPLLEKIELEPGELPVFAVHRGEAQALLTTRRFFWLNCFDSVESVRLSFIRGVGLAFGAGDPAYPGSPVHYVLDGKIFMGLPPAHLRPRDCNPLFHNPFMYLIDKDNNRYEIKLVEMFPIHTLLDALDSASEQVSEAKWRHIHKMDIQS